MFLFADLLGILTKQSWSQQTIKRGLRLALLPISPVQMPVTGAFFPFCIISAQEGMRR